MGAGFGDPLPADRAYLCCSLSHTGSLLTSSLNFSSKSPPNGLRLFHMGARRRSSPLFVAAAVICFHGGVRLKRRVLSGDDGGAGRVWVCSLLGSQGVTVVLPCVEIFSGPLPMLKVDFTHTGPHDAVSLVTSAGPEPPRSAQGISSHLPTCHAVTLSLPRA